MEHACRSLGELLEGHVALDVACFDRLYCNVYQRKLQTPGGTIYFLHDHRVNPIPSPALFRPMGDAYRKAVAAFAEDNGIEMITFKAGQRKIDVATPFLEKMKRPGVALIGRAQEVQWVTMGTDVRRDPDTGCPHYAFKKVNRRVTVYYYFYALDEEWGPTFLKMAAYFRCPTRASRGATGTSGASASSTRPTSATLAWPTYFAAVDDPEALQRLCWRLAGPQVADLFQRWPARVLPLGPAGFGAAYRWEALMHQTAFC